MYASYGAMPEPGGATLGEYSANGLEAPSTRASCILSTAVTGPRSTARPRRIRSWIDHISATAGVVTVPELMA